MTEVGNIWQASRLMAVFLILALTGNACAGVVTGATRVIVRESTSQTTVHLRATGNTVYLVIGRILNTEARATGDMTVRMPGFTILPPTFVMKGGQERQLRIISDDTGLPVDRESMMYLLVSSVPEGGGSQNAVQIGIRTWIKLFYRPAALEGKPLPVVNVALKDNNVVMKNSSPYYVSLSGVSVGGKLIPSPGEVPPFGEKHFAGCTVRTSCEVRWTQVGEDNRGREHSLTLSP